MRPHEHTMRVKISRHIIVKGRKNDVLFPVKRATGYCDRVFGMLQQMLSDRKRICKHLHPARGQRMNHLERGGATVYDDRLAICAEIYSSTCNGLLLRNLERFIHIERPPRQPDRLRRSQGFCPPSDAAQLFLNV